MCRVAYVIRGSLREPVKKPSKWTNSNEFPYHKDIAGFTQTDE
jgi:hypothetical protein